MDGQVLEYKFVIRVDAISPFDLASGWRAYQNNFEPSAVRGIPDVSISSRLESENQEETVSIISINPTTTTGNLFLKSLCILFANYTVYVEFYRPIT